jgi:hypothetical protein
MPARRESTRFMFVIDCIRSVGKFILFRAKGLRRGLEAANEASARA